MDITQIILVGVISILTLMLVFLGFQVFLILRDLRQSIRRANRIVDELGVQVTSEILKIIFISQKRRVSARNVNPGTKKIIEKIEEPTEKSSVKSGNGQIDEEKTQNFPLHFQLKPPRFFKGIPKRR